MGKAYIIVALGILAAKALGFFRDMEFARAFGTETAADIYTQVFGLVNLIFTGVGVALSTLVIKNLNKLGDRAGQKKYVAGFLGRTLLILVLVAILMGLGAPLIVKVILPDLSGADIALANRMMVAMVPSLVFVVAAYVISGVLQNEKVFFITAIMSLPYNVAIMAAMRLPGVSIMTVSIVTTVGWLLQVCMLLPAFIRRGYRVALLKGPAQKGRDPEILWIFLSNMMFQLCFYTDRVFVSGREAVFNYASNLFITISSVFVVAMSTVIFPAISKNYEEGKIGYVSDLLQYMITVMSAIFLPFLLVVGFFGQDVIRLVYERGKFTAADTAAVATVFFIYGLGVLGYVAQELFNKVLYLAGKYKYTVIGTVSVIAANLLANLLIVKVIYPADKTVTGAVTEAPAISPAALAIVISTTVLLTGYAVLVALGMKKVVGRYLTKELLRRIVKIFGAGAAACGIYVIFDLFAHDFTHGRLTFIVPLAFCGAVYIGVLAATGVLKTLIRNKKGSESA